MDETTNEAGAEGIQRWTTKSKATVILAILEGETSVAEAARKRGLTVAELKDWRERFLRGAENTLRARPNDEDALKDGQIKKLKQKLGELVLDILRETAPGASWRRICAVLHVALSSLSEPMGGKRSCRPSNP
jgi:transposase-like protein